MLVSDIVEAVEDQFTTETIDAERLGRLAGLAVKYYSRYNPFEKAGTLSLVADKQDYDLAADCILVRDVDYWPAGEVFGVLRTEEELVGGQQRYHFPSDQVIINIERTALVDRQGPRWEQIGSRKVRLHPAPTAVDTIDYQYYAVHALSADGKEYATVPDEDLEIIRDLALAEVIGSRGLEVTIEPDYAEGLQRVTKGRIPENVRVAVSKLRQGVRDKYGSGVVATQGSIA